jgi:DNA-binding IclR family transcriptional regulator
MEIAERRPRGRPRPAETVRLDAAVLKRLRDAGPATRNAIAAALHEKQSKVYLSLRRLREEGSVRKCQGEGAYTIWSASETCP